MPRRGQPSIIAGSLPWGAGGAGVFDSLSSSNPEAALASHYAQAYRSALDMNQANYNNILKGFQQTQAFQQGQTRGISRGYKGLMDSVLGRIEGVGRSDRQGITDRFAQERGASAQNLVDTGLGNSTIQSSIDRGLTYDEEKSNLLLSDQLAKMVAGFQSNLGQAHLGFRERGRDAAVGQRNQQMNWMNSVQAQYPDGGLYAQLAQGLGQAKEAKAQRDYLSSLMYQPQSGALLTHGEAGLWGLNAHNARAAAMRSIGEGGGFQGPQGEAQPGGMPGRASIPAPMSAQQSGGGYNPFTFVGSGGGSNPYGIGGYQTTGGFPAITQQNSGFNIGLGAIANGGAYTGGMSQSNPYGVGGGGFGGGFANPGSAYGAPNLTIDLSGLSGFGGLGGLFGAGGSGAALGAVGNYFGG